LGKIERQRIGNQIDAAMIFARADFVNVHSHYYQGNIKAMEFLKLARPWGFEPQTF
jgi:hypothetical protein